MFCLRQCYWQDDAKKNIDAWIFSFKIKKRMGLMEAITTKHSRGGETYFQTEELIITAGFEASQFSESAFHWFP